MAGNPREHVKGKGFWDGGAAGQDSNDQTAGRPSGFPGFRKPCRAGIRTDIEFPKPEEKPSPSGS
ncbi:MAG: hypothetical protein ABI779_08950 [Acidobacteriota bacterium]